MTKQMEGTNKELMKSIVDFVRQKARAYYQLEEDNSMPIDKLKEVMTTLNESEEKMFSFDTEKPQQEAVRFCKTIWDARRL